jgi:cytochrome d ubiquinol oxidase subunit II
VPALVLACVVLLIRAVKLKKDVQPFLLTLALFVLSYLGLAISVWPNVVPPSITIWDASSPPESQGFLLVGMLFLIPIILFYTAYSYYVFRGKVGDDGYH